MYVGMYVYVPTYVHIYIYICHVYTCRDAHTCMYTDTISMQFYALYIFCPHPSCEGCSAQSVGTFSLTIVNCQTFGIVSVTDSSFENQGTVCGTVSKVTADHICDVLDYGSAIDYGTAIQKG